MFVFAHNYTYRYHYHLVCLRRQPLCYVRSVYIHSSITTPRNLIFIQFSWNAEHVHKVRHVVPAGCLELIWYVYCKQKTVKWHCFKFDGCLMFFPHLCKHVLQNSWQCAESQPRITFINRYNYTKFSIFSGYY